MAKQEYAACKHALTHTHELDNHFLHIAKEEKRKRGTEKGKLAFNVDSRDGLSVDLFSAEPSCFANWDEGDEAKSLRKERRGRGEEKEEVEDWKTDFSSSIQAPSFLCSP